MKNLPSTFLAVNHEGVFRVYMNFEEVAGFDQLVSRHAQHRLILLKNMMKHPNGMIHIGVHTRDGLPILVLDATRGTMSISTHYQQFGGRSADSRWLSPRFYQSETSFQIKCEFDFALWEEAGFRMFFSINLYESNICMWTTYEGQNYRVPLGNVYEDGRICMGGGREEDLLESFFNNQDIGWVDHFTRLIDRLSSSHWNGDTMQPSMIAPISKLVRFHPTSLAMLPPQEAGAIKDLGVMANPTLAELTKSILHNG